MRNFKLVLCYDGTRYRGWQKQGNTDNTIQAKLEKILSLMLSEPVEVAGSGRTDAGVHAREQTCSFRSNTECSCEVLLHELRKHLPEDIGALSLEEAPARFHARLSCRGKTYVYRLALNDAPHVFDRNQVARWELPCEPDLTLMKCAALLLEGEHDFTSFTSNKHMKKSPVRTISQIRIEEKGEELFFSLTGDGFLYNMVRILVGTLLEVGIGRRSPEEMPRILQGKDRSLSGFTAPAKGLMLWEEYY